MLLSKFDFVGSYDNLTLNIVSALKVAIDWARDTDLDFVTVKKARIKYFVIREFQIMPYLGW